MANPAKKLKSIPFTSTEDLKKKFTVGDKSASIVCFVDEVLGTTTYFNKERGAEFDIFKILLNNNNGLRVQLNLYNETIKKHSKSFIMDEKIILERLTVTASKTYSKGNCGFDLTMHEYSTIEKIGEFDLLKNNPPIRIKFIDIPAHRGFIKIKAWLKNKFVQMSPKNNREFIGLLTDKIKKIDAILFADAEKLNFERGVRLEIIGDVLEKDGSLQILIKKFEFIKILSDDKLMPEEYYAPVEYISTKPNDE